MVDYTEWSTLRDDRLYGMVDSTGRDARDHNVSAGCNIRLGDHPYLALQLVVGPSQKLSSSPLCCCDSAMSFYWVAILVDMELT